MRDPDSYLHLQWSETAVRGPVSDRYLDTQTNKWRPKKRTFTVWLLWTENGKWNIYWCPDCRQPIAQYKGDLIMEHPGIDDTGASIPVKAPPILIQCKNADCGRKVMFQGFMRHII